MSILVEHPTNLTWDEFLALPYETRNASLIDGAVVVNSPNARHEWIISNLQLLFRFWIRAGADRGRICTQQPVKITDRRGYQPDFAWYRSYVIEDGMPSFPDPPNLIIEVLSRSTRRHDLVRKRRDYEQIGIGEVWFVEQDTPRLGVLTCQRIDDGAFVDREVKPGDRLTSPLLEGFSIDVADLYRLD